MSFCLLEFSKEVEQQNQTIIIIKAESSLLMYIFCISDLLCEKYSTNVGIFFQNENDKKVFYIFEK